MRCVDLQHLALDNSIPAGTGRTDKLTLVSDNRLQIPGLKQRPLGERRRIGQSGPHPFDPALQLKIQGDRLAQGFSSSSNSRSRSIRWVQKRW